MRTKNKTGECILLQLISDRPALTNTRPKNNAIQGRTILESLSSPNLEEPNDQNQTDIQILYKLAKQLKPTFDYLDLLVQNINHYVNKKNAQKKPVEELLKGAVQIERFFKKKLLDASERTTNPLITNLLKLTAHDVSLFAKFGRIAIIFKNNQITDKRRVCKQTWDGTSESQGVRTNLIEQKRLISSFFERIEQISQNKTGVSQEISHADFLKNLDKLFNQVQIDNWPLQSPISDRLTFKNQAITQTENPFDRMFTKDDFPIKLDQVLLNSILRNIINNAIENSPSDSPLNLEIDIVNTTDESKEKPYLHIKLNNLLADSIGFTEKNILEALQASKQVTTKQDPTETNGIFLKTLNSLMQENDGLLTISTNQRTNQDLVDFNLELKYPLEKSSKT
jgi:hypothetical protein